MARVQPSGGAIGPVAKLLTERESRRAPTRNELLQTLAAPIDGTVTVAVRVPIGRVDRVRFVGAAVAIVVDPVAQLGMR